MKPDRMLVDRYADQIGRIDATAFRAFARFRMPVWVGNTILLVAPRWAWAQLSPLDRRRRRRSRGSC